MFPRLLLLLWLQSTCALASEADRPNHNNPDAGSFGGRELLQLGTKSKARRHSTVAGSWQMDVASNIGTGMLWRIQVLGSGNFLFLRNGMVSSSKVFFSLFKLEQNSEGSMYLEVHGGGQIARRRNEKGTTYLQVGTTFNSSSTFWLKLRPHAEGTYSLDVPPDGKAFVCEATGLGQTHPEVVVVGDGHESSEGCDRHGIATNSLFRWQAIVSSTPSLPEAGVSFAQKVKRSAITVRGRQVAVATYHNVGMMHWAVLFWGWLAVAGIDRLLFLDLDGLSCSAAQTLRRIQKIKVHVNCVGVKDLELGADYEGGKKTSAIQEWGTRANSGYFKFLRMKLRLVELALQHHVDVVMADVDVLVLHRNFIPAMIDMGKDLAISSDARTGSYDDNRHCPFSNYMYQRYAADWVCAGLFYMRSSSGSSWVIQQVQDFMDSFAITDQDAFQAVLTGHTQVAMPQVPVKQEYKGKGKFQEGQASPLSPGYRPSGAFLKPLWLEDLSTPGNLRNLNNIQALNSPMRAHIFNRIQAKMRLRGFSWTILPVERYANGPVLFDNWKKIFSQPSQQNLSLLSIHSNCNTKPLLENQGENSFLLSPK